MGPSWSPLFGCFTRPLSRVLVKPLPWIPHKGPYLVASWSPWWLCKANLPMCFAMPLAWWFAKSLTEVFYKAPFLGTAWSPFAWFIHEATYIGTFQSPFLESFMKPLSWNYMKFADYSWTLELHSKKYLLEIIMQCPYLHSNVMFTTIHSWWLGWGGVRG